MVSIKNIYKKTGSLSRWLLLVIGMCLLCTLILFIFQVKPNSLSFIRELVYPRYTIGDDSWRAMIAALKHIKKLPQEPVYDVLFSKGIKFQYPLSSLLVFDLPQRITGASYDQIVRWLNCISFCCIIVLGLISGRILTLVLKQKRFKNLTSSSTAETVLLYFLVLVLLILFYPIIKSYTLGQIQTLLTILTALSILFWLRDKKIAAGILFGFITLIKPQLGILFLWGIIRRQWKMVLPGAIVIIVFFLISINYYGFSNNLYYLKVLSFLSHHGESYHANQSINGILNRLLFNGDSINWDGRFPPYSPLIYMITFVSSLIIMLFGLLWNYKTKKPDTLDLCIVILCTTMASPIAWEHHYAILLPIFILLSPYVCLFYKNRKGNLFLLAVGYLFASQYFDFTKSFANTGLNILLSYLFLGACIILFFLVSVSRKILKEERLE